MKNLNNRRHFLRNTASILALSGLHYSGLAQWSSEKKKRVALIGSGWYGKSDLFRLMQTTPVEIAGLCDVDRQMLEEAGNLVSERLKSNKALPLYHDYRTLLKEQQPDIVLIGSPDHWHALQAIAAIESGAHVYLQKPISVDVLEGEAILAAARKHNKTVQIGLQRRSTPHLVEAKRAIVETGLLGKVHHVELCCYYHMRNNSSPALQTVPDYFDYDFWTGPAPLREFDGMPHRGWWRAFMEYGNGIMGDMCVHMFDAARWMLDLGWPKKISSSGGIYSGNPGKSNIADTQTAVFEYENLNCVWQHRTWGTSADPEYPWAFKIYGEKGTLSASVMKYDFISTDGKIRLHKDVTYEREKYPEDISEKNIELHTAPATRNHMLNFIQAIEQGTIPEADVEQGHISSASCIIANLSMKLGRALQYDPVLKIIKNDAEATQLLARKYRGPWVHPYLNKNN